MLPRTTEQSVRYRLAISAYTWHMWHFNPLLSTSRQLRRMLAIADAVPRSLKRTVLFAVFEAQAKKQPDVDDCHLLLGALRELGDDGSRFPIDPATTRDHLSSGLASEGPIDFSPKAMSILARCRTPEDVVEQLCAEKWVRP